MNSLSGGQPWPSAKGPSNSWAPRATLGIPSRICSWPWLARLWHCSHCPESRSGRSRPCHDRGRLHGGNDSARMPAFAFCAEEDAGMTESLRIVPVRGQAIAERLQELAQLRIRVFREFPYLYEGSED